MTQLDLDHRWAKYLANPAQLDQIERSYFYVLLRRHADGERVMLLFPAISMLLAELPHLQEIANLVEAGRFNQGMTVEETQQIYYAFTRAA